MIFVKGLGAPETPRLLPTDKGWLCVEMAPPRSGVTRISRDGARSRRSPRPACRRASRPTWTASSGRWTTTPTPCLMRVTLDGDVEVVLDAVEGKPMLLHQRSLLRSRRACSTSPTRA